MGSHASDVICQVRTVVEEPLHPSLESRQLIEDFLLQSLYREERDQSNHGADLHGEVSAVRQFQHVVEEAIFLVPQSDAVVAAMAHRVGDIDKVFPEFACHVLVNRIMLGEFQGDGQ